MDWVDLVIGRQPGALTPALPEIVITAAPKGVTWTHVTTRADARTVRARLARRSGRLSTKHGAVSYRKERHYIVDYGGGDRAVARRDIFDRIYTPLGGGRYAKRPEIAYRYFTLPYDVTVNTAEGPEAAEAGDWIMEGVEGELYPIRPDHARKLYQTL